MVPPILLREYERTSFSSSHENPFYSLFYLLLPNKIWRPRSVVKISILPSTHLVNHPDLHFSLTSRNDNTFPRITRLIDFPPSQTLLSFARKKRIINRFICATNLIYSPREACARNVARHREQKHQNRHDLRWTSPPPSINPAVRGKHKIDGHLNVRNHFRLSNFCQPRRELSSIYFLRALFYWGSEMKNGQRSAGGAKKNYPFRILLSNEKSSASRGKLISPIALIMERTLSLAAEFRCGLYQRLW